MRASSCASTTTWRARSVKRSNTIRSFYLGVGRAPEAGEGCCRYRHVRQAAQDPSLPRSRHGTSLAMGSGRKARRKGRKERVSRGTADRRPQTAGRRPEPPRASRPHGESTSQNGAHRRRWGALVGTRAACVARGRSPPHAAPARALRVRQHHGARHARAGRLARRGHRAAGAAVLYMRAATDYLVPGRPATFRTLVEAARRRGEVAVGYRADGRVVINPRKSETLALGDRDRVVVLAEE